MVWRWLFRTSSGGRTKRPPSQELARSKHVVATIQATRTPTTRGLTKVRECERSQPLVPRVFTTTRYSRSELRRPCCFCQVEFPASELRQHAKECGRRWLRRKNAVARRRQSAQRFPCGNQHVQNRGCQPSQAQNNVAVQAAPSQLEVARTSTRQQQSEDGALQALASQRCSVLQSPYSGDSLRRTLTSSPHTTRTGRAQHRLAKASVPEQQNQDASRRKQQTHDIYATSSGLAFSDSKSTYESRACRPREVELDTTSSLMNCSAGSCGHPSSLCCSNAAGKNIS